MTIFSLQRKLLFIHLARTGGTSIYRLLQNNFPDAAKIGTRWATALAVEKQLGPDTFDSLWRFAIVRNPWDRLLSHYANYCWENGRFHRKLAREDKLRHSVPTRDDFTEWATKRRRYAMFLPQLFHLCDNQGNMLVQDIGRFEEYERATRTICERLGLNWASLKHLRQVPHEHYSHYYTDETRELVGKQFKADIDYFGYTFQQE